MTNIAILTGRIVRDPDSRETKGGTNVTGITVVTDRPARDKVDFLSRGNGSGENDDNKDAPEID